MNMRFLIMLASIVTCYGAAFLKRFDGYKVYKVTPTTSQQFLTLKQLEENSQEYTFWSNLGAVGKPVIIMVPPYLKCDFDDLLKVQQMEAELWIENVQNNIDNERRESINPLEHDWKRYQTFDEINAWLNSLVIRHSKYVTPVIGGKSYEGRSIRGVKLSFAPGKKSVFLEGGIHAREWISPATVTYILNELLTSNSTEVRALAESRDWYFFPCVNPDGYVYTHTTDRMWRKTRKPYGKCYGSDPNRNWGYHWMEGGSSNNSCSQNYAGDAAFSDIETKTLSQYIDSISDTLEAYITFHSFAQALLIPFGYSNLEKPKNNEELLRIGKAAVESLSKRYGTKYTVANIPEAMNYSASGSSMDWVLGSHKHVRLVYTYELRERGKNAFILPPEQIIPTGQETLDSLIRMFQEADL